MSRKSTAYGAAYDQLLKRGLSDPEWIVIENFYRDLQALGREHGFDVLVAIMPVVDIVTGERPDQHPYRVEARRRLERLGIEYVDGFNGQRGLAFLPQGRDAHSNPEGYRVVAEALAGKLVESRALKTPAPQ